MRSSGNDHSTTLVKVCDMYMWFCDFHNDLLCQSSLPLLSLISRGFLILVKFGSHHAESGTADKNKRKNKKNELSCTLKIWHLKQYLHGRSEYGSYFVVDGTFIIYSW